MKAEHIEWLDKIFSAVSSAQTSLVMLSEQLAEEDFEALNKAHFLLTETEIELCNRLAKFKGI